MNHCSAGWKRSWRGALIIGALGLMAGCQAKEKIQESRLYSRIVGKNHIATPGEMAAKGKEAITVECGHGTWANVRRGLIVAEPGSHENVFSLRDRFTFRTDPYPLEAARLLVAQLRTEVSSEQLSTDQNSCIRQFAEHLQGLTDQLTATEAEQKELNTSAFNEAQKQTDELPGSDQPSPGH